MPNSDDCLTPRRAMKRLFQALAVTLFLLFLSPASAFGNTVEYAIDVYEKGDYDRAYELYLKFAEDGDATAQNNLGAMYENGEGCTKNLPTAMAW